MKIRAGLVVLSLTLAVALPFTVMADTDISGSYKCTGTDPFQKSTYQSDLSIAKLGDTFTFKWGQGGKDFGGTGILSKAASNIVAAEFWSPANNNNSGVIIYQIQTDGTLDGNWAIADQSLIGSETCKKAAAVSQ
jgi:hypothetical protein